MQTFNSFQFFTHSIVSIFTHSIWDAATICTTGGTKETFETQGTGDRLVLQVNDTLEMPAEETNLTKTVWTKGKCLPTMGKLVLLFFCNVQDHATLKYNTFNRTVHLSIT